MIIWNFIELFRSTSIFRRNDEFIEEGNSFNVWGLCSFLYFTGKIEPDEDQLIQKQRAKIRAELTDYDIHQSLNTQNFSHLIPDEGGKPVRSLVVTTWRSGSTFLGDVLLAHPATYYHYEPLLDIGITQARYGQLADLAVNNLNNLMYCNYTGMNHYLDYEYKHPWLLNHNTRLWWICFAFRSFCHNQRFLSNYCSLFPFQSIKVVRLRMNLTETFLKDPNLDVRVLLLVRDPRGTLQSRKHRDWCPGVEDCDSPKVLCEDLVSDYHAAKKLSSQFPGRVRLVFILLVWIDHTQILFNG